MSTVTAAPKQTPGSDEVRMENQQMGDRPVTLNRTRFLHSYLLISHLIFFELHHSIRLHILQFAVDDISRRIVHQLRVPDRVPRPRRRSANLSHCKADRQGPNAGQVCCNNVRKQGRRSSDTGPDELVTRQSLLPTYIYTISTYLLTAYCARYNKYIGTWKLHEAEEDWHLEPQ